MVFNLKKKGNFDTYCNMDGPLRLYTKLNKEVTKGQVIFNSIYVRYSDQSNSQRENTEWWFSGSGTNGELLFNGYRMDFQFEQMKKSADRL